MEDDSDTSDAEIQFDDLGPGKSNLTHKSVEYSLIN